MLYNVNASISDRGSSSTMEIPLYDVEYTDDMADESSDSYQVKFRRANLCIKSNYK